MKKVTSVPQCGYPNFHTQNLSARQNSKSSTSRPNKCPDCNCVMPLFGDGLSMMSDNSQGIYTCPNCKKIWEKINGKYVFTSKYCR